MQSLIHLGGVFGSDQNPQCFVNVLLVVKYRQEQSGREMEETFCSHQLWFSIVQSREERQKMGGFFSHMCSRFPGRRTMTHWLQALNLCLDSNQRSHPPERCSDCESLFALHRHSHQLAHRTTAWAWKYQWTLTTWRVISLPFVLFERTKVRRIMRDGIQPISLTCCGAFREGATFLTQQVNYFGMFFRPAPLTMETPPAV